MKRIYKTEQTVKPKFFVGGEVEKTPAFGQKTLFVVDIQDVALTIETAQKNTCSHVYVGANHSYVGNDPELWTDFVMLLLERSELMVTFDFSITDYPAIYRLLLNTEIGRSRKFIPMIRMPLMGVEVLNPNTTVKIDDHTFDYSNSAVWCHSVSRLLDSNQATHWNEYGQDDIIE